MPIIILLFSSLALAIHLTSAVSMNSKVAGSLKSTNQLSNTTSQQVSQLLATSCISGLMESLPPEFCWKSDKVNIAAQCPRGYSNIGVVCLKNCDSGWDDWGTSCAKKCPRGETTVGNLC